MKLVRMPTLIVNRGAVRARLDIALHAHTDESVIDSLVDIPALIAEIENLLRHESQHRYEFADLLAAARDVLSAADRDHFAALSRLAGVVDLHRDITVDDLDEWRGWTDPNRKEALTN
jgi:hypothetical protein